MLPVPFDPSKPNINMKGLVARQPVPDVITPKTPSLKRLIYRGEITPPGFTRQFKLTRLFSFYIYTSEPEQLQTLLVEAAACHGSRFHTIHQVHWIRVMETAAVEASNAKYLPSNVLGRSGFLGAVATSKRGPGAWFLSRVSGCSATSWFLGVTVSGSQHTQPLSFHGVGVNCEARGGRNRPPA